MNKDLERRVYQVVSDVLGVPVSELDDESSSDSITSWTSINHLNLITALEFEFGLEFSPEDALEMLSVKLIIIILQDQISEQERLAQS